MLKFPENLRYELEKNSGISFSTTAYPFEIPKVGVFSGYYGYNENTNMFFRINFPLKRSNNIVSHIDFFENIFFDTPDYTIYPSESTISNIVHIIVHGEKEPLIDETPLTESVASSRREQLFQFWVKEDEKAKNTNYLTSNSVEDVYTKAFLRADKNNSEVPLAWFRQKYKEYITSLGIQLKRGRKSQGKRERVIDDPERRNELLGSKENFDFEQNLEVLKQYTQGVIDGKVPSLLIYGGPGIGKSHIVNKMIQDSGLIDRKDYIYYSGVIKDIKTLAELLYNHGGAKDGKPKLIVFDDFTMPKDEGTVDVLAKIMDTNPLLSRTVTVADSKLIAEWEKIRTELDDERNAWIDSFVAKKKARPSPAEIKAFEKEQVNRPKVKRKAPLSFPFDGRIIIIANDKNLHPKLLSRTLKILIDPTNTEVVGMIKKDSFSPDVNKAVKDEVIALLEYVSSGVETIDFRDYFHAVTIYQLLSPLGKEIWKHKVIDNILMKEKS